MKTCSKCGEEKPLEEFSKSRSTASGYQSQCKTCAKESTRKWYAENRDEQRARVKRHRQLHPEQRRDAHLRRKFGITLTEFNALLDAQDGACAICKTKEPGGVGEFHVDHCHQTGAVRGILCYACNTGIGKLGDTYESVQRAADYLRR